MCLVGNGAANLSQSGYNTLPWTKGWRFSVCLFLLSWGTASGPLKLHNVFQNFISGIRTGLSWTNWILQLRISELCINVTSRYSMGVSWLMITLIWVISDNILGYRILCLYLWLWLWYWDPVKASKELLIPFCTLYRRFDPTLIAESKFFHAWNYSIQYLKWMDRKSDSQITIPWETNIWSKSRQ